MWPAQKSSLTIFGNGAFRWQALSPGDLSGFSPFFRPSHGSKQSEKRNVLSSERLRRDLLRSQQLVTIETSDKCYLLIDQNPFSVFNWR
jgi:hypothetical protein